jgi:hypothetical protein
MVLPCFVSEGIITVLIVLIPSETKHSNAILWEQLWYPRKQSTTIPYYENSYDTLGNKLCFRGYHNCSHNMALLCFVSDGIITVLIVWYCCALFPRVTVMIPSEAKHSNSILWEQLWYHRKQSTAIQYYENSYDTLVSLCSVSEGIITVLIIWYCCALLPRVGSKAQRYHTMRTAMIPSEAKQSDTILWEQYNMALLCFVSEGIITVLIVWYCCALFLRVS